MPTGMNAGVRSVPRCIAIVPVRAAPSVAAIVKAKREVIPRSMAAAYRFVDAKRERSSAVQRCLPSDTAPPAFAIAKWRGARGTNLLYVE
ncbi:hypothetical protein GCM10009106_20630 [Sphingomonas japonica]